MIKNKILYTVEEAKVAVAVSHTHLYTAIAKNELRSIKIGRLRRFTHEALHEYAQLLERRSSGGRL